MCSLIAGFACRWAACGSAARYACTCTATGRLLWMEAEGLSAAHWQRAWRGSVGCAYASTTYLQVRPSLRATMPSPAGSPAVVLALAVGWLVGVSRGELPRKHTVNQLPTTQTSNRQRSSGFRGSGHRQVALGTLLRAAEKSRKELTGTHLEPDGSHYRWCAWW